MFPWTLSFTPFAWLGMPALHALGYSSVFEYGAVMVLEFLFFMLVCPASGHAVYPCLLWCVKCLDKSLDRGRLQTAVAFGGGLLLFSLSQLEASFFYSSLESFMLTQHPAFLGFCVLAVVLAMFQHYMLFGAGWPQRSSREVGM
ncbi:unnamed protein product [Symbiodinium sp. CCMP2456]|nr:unnamed protein product [Symbiodinium sp. CCMP2456]